VRFATVIAVPAWVLVLFFGGVLKYKRLQNLHSVL
jgi:hypothetical protein